MTTLELYRKHKAGDVSRDRFIYEVRKNTSLPWITNLTSYDDAVKILKNKGIISEAVSIKSSNIPSKVTGYARVIKLTEVSNSSPEEDKAIWLNMFQDALVAMGHEEASKSIDPVEVIELYGMFKPEHAAPAFIGDQIPSKNRMNEADANIATDPAVDIVNPYYLKKGVQKLLDKEEELTNDSYIIALNKAAKMLVKDPHVFDEDMFANAKEVEKEDTKLQTQEVKKDNHIDKNSEMKKVKVKALKEAALKELTNSLKKKESIKEDVHPVYNVGSAVHTPSGEGTVKEIIGSTITVEMKNGIHQDWQVNVLDKATEKAKQREADGALSKSELDAAWSNWDKQGQKTFGGQLTDPEYWKKPLDPEAIKKYIDMYKDDKEKMRKLKEVLKMKKLKEFTTAKTKDAVHNAEVIRQIDRDVTSPTAKAALKTSFNKGNPIDL